MRTTVHTTQPTRPQAAPQLSPAERRLALVVGLCVAACREALIAPNRAEDGTLFAQSLGRFGIHQYNKRDHLGSGPSGSESQPPGVPQDLPPTASEPKLLLTVEEAAQRLSVGRPKMWQLVMRGDVVSLKIGASRRVSVAALEDYVQRLTAEASGQPMGNMRKGEHDDDTRMA